MTYYRQGALYTVNVTLFGKVKKYSWISIYIHIWLVGMDNYVTGFFANNQYGTVFTTNSNCAVLQWLPPIMESLYISVDSFQYGYS